MIDKIEGSRKRPACGGQVSGLFCSLTVCCHKRDACGSVGASLSATRMEQVSKLHSLCPQTLDRVG
jgi:hypothetical protein